MSFDREEDQKLKFKTSKKLKVSSTFESMNLKDDLLRGIYSYGFEAPSSIQSRAITQIISGKDVIAQAQSGTGKTATFTIGLLQAIDLRKKDLQALILSPTRELASQIGQVVKNLGDYMNVNAFAITGGKTLKDDLKKMQKHGCQAVSGTPGRVLDMIMQNIIH